jgi:hypothetical protein
MVLAFALAFALALPASAQADGFQVVSDRSAFVQLIENRELRRFGISLRVSPEGAIEGRAFGTPVTGAWRWENGYFCRDLFYGGDDLGANCQLVELRGETLRFTSDRGQGDYADLRLE